MNSFGRFFRITTFGESHGSAIGVVIDGCPPGISLNAKDFYTDLSRRKTSQNRIVSSRKEEDQVEILSGVFEGKTLGTPITLMVRNTDAKPKDYEQFKNIYRPSHADFTYDIKYGVRDFRGGGRASARETVARVMAGIVAKKVLKDVEILAYVKQVGSIVADVNPEKVTLKQVELNAVRCPDQKTAKKMITLIQSVQKRGDTVGGVVECIARRMPAGLGDPVFDKLKATLAHAMMSLPAAVGFEAGTGFGCLTMRGSKYNDPFAVKKGKIVTKTNNSGGIQGGISNGMPIIFRVCFKPVSTIFQEQETVTCEGKKTKIILSGRHDPCVVPRAAVIVETMAAIVMADHWLRQKMVTSFC